MFNSLALIFGKTEMLWRWIEIRSYLAIRPRGFRGLEANCSMQVGQNQVNRKKARRHSTFSCAS